MLTTDGTDITGRIVLGDGALSRRVGKALTRGRFCTIGFGVCEVICWSYGQLNVDDDGNSQSSRFPILCHHVQMHHKTVLS